VLEGVGWGVGGWGGGWWGGVCAFFFFFLALWSECMVKLWNAWYRAPEKKQFRERKYTCLVLCALFFFLCVLSLFSLCVLFFFNVKWVVFMFEWKNIVTKESGYRDWTWEKCGSESRMKPVLKQSMFMLFYFNKIFFIFKFCFLPFLFFLFLLIVGEKN